MLYRFLKPIVTLLYKLLFKLKVKGRHYVPRKEGFILASNHLSYLDPVTLGVASPRRLYFMAKDELFKIPIFSRLITMLGAIPIKRDQPDLSGLNEAIKKLKKGAAVVLFPQGSRTDLSSCEVRPGIGFLAANADVPIVPTLIKGTDVALPKGSRFIRRAKIEVYFGEPIFIERRRKPNYREIAIEVMSRIRNLSCK